MKDDYVADGLFQMTSYRQSLHATLESVPAGVAPAFTPTPPLCSLQSISSPGDRPSEEKSANNYQGEQSPGEKRPLLFVLDNPALDSLSHFLLLA